MSKACCRDDCQCGTDNGAQPADYTADNATDTDQDFASDQDFGGGDSDNV